ncbi:MAG: porin [Burkholderiaceae bacterium]
MKKTLVALAALATVGLASAQSSVTLYGKIDWTIQNQTQKINGVSTAANNPGWQVNSAGLSGSRWGMKGSEDLGGGLNAVFQLESGFNVDGGNSAQGGLLFGRQAYAGLKGNFGTFTVGRQYSPYDNIIGAYDGQGYTSNSAMGYAWNGNGAAIGVNGIHQDIGRINNSIYYATPAMGGFRASAMVAPGENKIPGVQSSGDLASISLGYGNGPISVDAVYERIKSPFTGSATNALYNFATNTSVWMLGGAYDFGAAKLYAGYERARATGGSHDTGWMLGVGVPFGAFSFNLGYASEKTTMTGLGFDGRNRGLGGQLVYSLSKRTNVYADFLTGKTRSASAFANAPETKNNIFGVGMRHDF